MGERPWNSWNSRQAVLSRPRVSPKSFRFFSGTTISTALSIIEMSCMKKKNRPVAARSRAPAWEIAQAATATAPPARGVPSTVQAWWSGPEMILMASFGTGATLCCASPAVDEADKLLRHVRGVRRDENLVIGIQNQRHGLLDLRPRPPVPGGAPANAFHTFWCPPRRKVSCRRNLSGTLALKCFAALSVVLRRDEGGQRRVNYRENERAFRCLLSVHCGGKSGA